MPIPEDVRDFLADLLGKPVSVTKRSAFPFTDEDDAWITGRYISDSDRLVGASIADLPLAASIGAALALISADVAKESVKAGELIESLRDNFHEVLNIMSGLLNGPSVPHLRLDDVADGVPADVAELVTSAPGRKYYDVTIVGYAGGRLALIGV